MFKRRRSDEAAESQELNKVKQRLKKVEKKVNYLEGQVSLIRREA